MHPAVTATVVVVGAIAAAFFYVFNNDQLQTHQSYGNRRRENPNNFHYTNITNNNYYGGRPTNTENECQNRKKQRKKVTMKNDKCGICLEYMWGELEILSCDHAFHVKCLEDYRASAGGQARCPLCRESMD